MVTMNIKVVVDIDGSWIKTDQKLILVYNKVQLKCNNTCAPSVIILRNA